MQAKGDSYVMQLLNIIVSGTEESLLMGVVDVLLVVPLLFPGPVSELQPVLCYILNDLLQSVALMDELVWFTEQCSCLAVHVCAYIHVCRLLCGDGALA